MKKLIARDVKLVIGGESRVELLPPEVAARTKAQGTRRALVGVIVLATLICGAGYGFASISAELSASELAAEQGRTSKLLQEQAKFIEVSLVEEQLATAIAAEQLGSATEIDWRTYMNAVHATLPEGVTIAAFTADTATPLQPYAQPTVPLQGQRIATLVFTATSVDLPKIEQWLDSLVTLDGFVDATPGSVSANDEGAYSLTVTMHVDSDAYSNRFAPAATLATQEGEGE